MLLRIFEWLISFWVLVLHRRSRSLCNLFRHRGRYVARSLRYDTFFCNLKTMQSDQARPHHDPINNRNGCLSAYRTSRVWFLWWQKAVWNMSIVSLPLVDVCSNNCTHATMGIASAMKRSLRTMPCSLHLIIPSPTGTFFVTGAFTTTSYRTCRRISLPGSKNSNLCEHLRQNSRCYNNIVGFGWRQRPALRCLALVILP